MCHVCISPDLSQGDRVQKGHHPSVFRFHLSLRTFVNSQQGQIMERKHEARRSGNVHAGVPCE